MRRARKLCLYVYHDPISGKRYFHDPITNEVYWRPVEGSYLIDAKSNEQIIVGESDMFSSSEYFEIKKQKINYSRTTHRISTLPIILNSHDMNIQRTRHQRRSECLYGSFIDKNINDISGLPIYIPGKILEDQKPLDICKFCVENFNNRTRGGVFSKKPIPPEELFNFSTDKTEYPILVSTPQFLQKNVLKLHKYITGYCKQKPKYNPYIIVQYIHKEQRLIDEAYIMVLKLTRNNPDEAYKVRLWGIMLTLCTYFPPLPTYQPLIRHILSTNAMAAAKNGIPHIAKVAYIRFIARCDSCEVLPLKSEQWTNLIPTHTTQFDFVFGAPLLELLYRQRQISPKATIPIFMHKICQEILNAGGKKMENVFCLPGNKSVIDMVVQYCDEGKVQLDKVDLIDLTSVLKRWLGDLPDSLIPISLYWDLEISLKRNSLMAFIDKLPKVNHDTLGYLIGFLQEFVEVEKDTKVGVKQLSLVFGINVVRTVNTSDQYGMKQVAEVGSRVVTYLLENWDTSFIYPLPKNFLE